jgi:YD repeat-containing protein
MPLFSMTDRTGTSLFGYHPPGQWGAGQLASVNGPLANDTIQYVYDRLGRLLSRTIGASAESVVRDDLGRVTEHTSPLSATPTTIQ